MQTFVDAFLYNATKTPSNVAVMDSHGADTYSKVNRKSSLLAQKILAHTEGRNARIALLLPRNRDYVTSLVAVIRSGGGCGSYR